MVAFDRDGKILQRIPETFFGVMVKQRGNKVIQVMNKKECCGCAACEAICPVGAIKMELDEEGFYYPSINLSACISCGLCKEVCAFL